MHARLKRSGRLAGPLVAAATWSLFGLADCGKDERTEPDMGAQSPGPPTKSVPVAAIDRPLAAVLSPDGKTIYVAAHDTNGLAALFSVPAAGGTPTKLNTTGTLIHPVGLAISPNGATLYIVDSAGGSEDAGAVYNSTTSGTMVGGSFTGIRAPAGIAISADGKTVYITGFDTAGQPGVFSTGAGGGAAVAVAKGAPFSNPSAVAVTADGTVYVVDTTALGPTRGAVIKVSGTTGVVFTQQPLSVGFSAGISPNGVGSNDLLITANTGLGNGAIYNVNTTGASTALPLGTTFFDPATIHRAANVSVWVAIDSVNAMQVNPAQQLGEIYLLTP